MENKKHGNLLDIKYSKNNSNESAGSSLNLPSTTELKNKDKYYETKNNIGIALIFNHYEFSDNSLENLDCNGIKKDKEDIKNALERYGFDVRKHDNKKYEEIRMILSKVSQENHTENDCLVVVVTTHGNNKILAAYDKNYPVQDLWTPFFGENCEKLINKPKLFFINACRGDGVEKPIEYKDSGSSFSPIYENIYIIPNSADILTMYSSNEGYGSTLDENKGSWFIQSLSKILNQEYSLDGIDLYNLLTLVNHEVAYEYQRKDDKSKQMPNFVSTLTKLFLIKPKPKN